MITDVLFYSDYCSIYFLEEGKMYCIDFNTNTEEITAYKYFSGFSDIRKPIYEPCDYSGLSLKVKQAISCILEEIYTTDLLVP